MKYAFFVLVLCLNLFAFAQPTASFSVSDNVICEGECIDIENTSSNDVVSSSWSFPSGTPSFYSGMNPGAICFNVAGTYTLTLTVTDGTGATSSASQVLTVGAVPSISISLLDTVGGVVIPDTIIPMYGGMNPAGSITTGAVITATGFVAGDSLVWVPNTVSCIADVTGACDTVIASPFYATYYILNNYSPEGCLASDTVFVDVKFRDSLKVRVPDAFSPNDDGENDVLRVITNVDIDANYANGYNGEGGAIANMNFEVFNRYGQLVFRTTNPQEGWDGTFKGKPLNPGTFLFKLEYRLINGLSYAMNGNVTLYR